MKSKTPQKILRDTIDLCADCDSCRGLMDEDCLFFPELYRLHDREAEEGSPITTAEMRSLVDLCTLCGLCPCPAVPAGVMEAKSLYVGQEGLPLAIRLFTDVPRIARLCGSFPRLVNALHANKITGSVLRKVTNVHPDRQLPLFPEQNFFQWAEQKGLTSRREGARTVAYFAGCTAAYLFPQVGQAFVEVLERNGLTVYVPPQECCGMPNFVEGDRNGTLQRVRATIDRLQVSIRNGDDLVCSCPTCGFFMKMLIKERAYYSEAYQESVHAGDNEIKVPHPGRGEKTFRVARKSGYKEILKDDGYFSTLDPMGRIGLAEHLSDAGEYLVQLHAEGLFDTRFTALTGRLVYFVPCHQREQKIGSHYLELLTLIPGISIEQVGSANCCGMGGNFGFKAEFHEKSLNTGKPLMTLIREKDPQAIITDCISCRLQFSHALPYPVFHPLEILARAYQAGDAAATESFNACR